MLYEGELERSLFLPSARRCNRLGGMIFVLVVRHWQSCLLSTMIGVIHDVIHVVLVDGNGRKPNFTDR